MSLARSLVQSLTLAFYAAQRASSLQLKCPLCATVHVLKNKGDISSTLRLLKV